MIERWRAICQLGIALVWWTLLLANLGGADASFGSCAATEPGAGVAWWPEVPPPGPQTENSNELTRLRARRRIVVLPDVHGDADAMLALLDATEVARSDPDGRVSWRGADAVLVQLGDVLDRGDEEFRALDILWDLKAQARECGGEVHLLLGNHEVMNLMGDFRYVAPGAWAQTFNLTNKMALDDVSERVKQRAQSIQHPLVQRRAQALLAGGSISRRIFAYSKVALIIGSHLFVHAGVIPQTIPGGVESLHALNVRTQSFVRGNGAEDADMDFALSNLAGPDAVVWTRRYGMPMGSALSAAQCSDLRRVLKETHTSTMFIGHTIQFSGINGACHGAAWRMDTGMSKFYGGVREAIEILDGEISIISLAAGEGTPMKVQIKQRLLD
ncbi:Shewanella-like protein phosphatase 2 [Porphyridium purpureum]|uniref:Shewanella-like protein phosphatase 2 n=1 Tax=Porphyridium purpureum TaxID=35688 RepID=A0A5J4Z2Z8_PORPP|nr:Shewanella-like protein phosphatase 2 [Porphyridium purpureum]|eukprot:POR5903..scf295_1